MIIGVLVVLALAAPRPAAAQTTGTISGSVTSGATPLASVTVKIFNSAPTQIATATTNAAGAYSVANLAPGTYYARTENSAGYLDELYDNKLWGTVPVSEGTAIPVSAGATATVNFDLAVGSRIVGYVSPPDSTTLYLFNSDGFVTQVWPVGGHYETPALVSGTYYLRTHNTRGFLDQLYDGLPCFDECPAGYGTPIVLGVGEVRTINFTLVEGGRIAGTVHGPNNSVIVTYDRKGYPVYPEVRIYDTAGRNVGYGIADGTGAYETTFRGFPTGTYYAVAYAPGPFPYPLHYAPEIYRETPCPGQTCAAITQGTPIEVTTGQVTRNINFTLDVGVRIRGTVYAESAGKLAPQRGVDVLLLTADNTVVGSAPSNEYGWYEFTNVSAGTYYLRTSNRGGFIDEIYDNVPCSGTCNDQLPLATPIVAAAGQTIDAIDFALSAGGRISGRITDTSASPAPLANVRVEVYDLDARLLASGRTAADGTYVTDHGLPSGSYVALTSDETGAYLNEVFDNVPCSGACTPSAPGATLIDVTLGSTTPNINFALQRGGSISGRITATSGAPLVGFNVLAQHASTGVVTKSSTIADGLYTLRGLPSGSYYVRTDYSAILGSYVNEIYDNIPCVACDATAGTAVTVTVGNATSGIDFVLRQAGGIAGVVTDAVSGGVLVGAWADVYTSGGQLAASFRTDSGGAYMATGLTTGNYFVRVRHTSAYINELYNDIPCPATCDVTTGTPVAVTEGATTGHVDVALARSPRGGVSGTITDDHSAEGIPGVTVSLYNSNNVLMATGVTNAGGQYTIGNLAAGTYYARTANTSGYRDEVYDNLPCTGCDLGGGTAISVTAGATATVDFRLTAGARISGTVSATDGTPVRGIDVRVYDGQRRLVAAGRSNDLGRFTTGAGLPAGQYYVITFNRVGYVDQIYTENSAGGQVNEDCVGCDPPSGSVLVLAEKQQRTGVDFVLRTGGRLAGRVTNSDGALALGGVTVEIFNAVGRLVTSVVTNLDGRYQSDRGLATASYFVKSSETSSLAGELYQRSACLDCDVTAGTPVAVAEGSTTSGIDFALRAGGTFSGTVTDAQTSQPIGGVSVWIYNEAKRRVAIAVTGANGKYTSGALPADSPFYLRTDNALHYINQRFTIGDPSCYGDCDLGDLKAYVPAAGTRTIDFALAIGGAISGRITSGGAPLAGITVEAKWPSSGVFDRTTTDADGRYITRAGLLAGNYYVRTSNTRGYLNEVYDNIACGNGSGVSNCPSTGTPVAAAAGTVTTDRDFDLLAGGRIEGTVTDASTGMGVPNITVRVNNQYPVADFTAVTDRVGHYTIPAPMRSGTYSVGTTNTAAYINASQSVAVVVGVTARVDFALTPGGRVRGTVRALTTGGAIANEFVEIYLLGGGGNYAARAQTDSAGRYQTDAGLPGGRYFAVVSASGFLREQSPEFLVAAPGTTEVNFNLVKGGAITGVVTASDNTPLSGVRVVAVGPDNASGTTGTDGRYVLKPSYAPGIRAGTYYVHTEAPSTTLYIDEWYDDVKCSTCTELYRAVEVTNEATTSGVNFALDTGGAIAGQVTGATGLQTSGYIDVYSSDGVLVKSGVIGPTEWRVSGLPAGTYFLRAQRVNAWYIDPHDVDPPRWVGTYFDEIYNDIACSYDRVCSITAGTPVTVAAGATTTGIDFTLTLGYSIQGSVVDAAANVALTWGNVSVYDGLGRLVTTVRVDNGRYAAAGLRDGTYYAVVAADEYLPQLYRDSACFPGCVVTSGTPIVIAGASIENANFALSRGGRIAGQVREDSDSATPLVNVRVDVYTADGRMLVASGLTDGTGHYSTSSGLGPGQYKVRTSNTAGYVNEAYDNIVCLGSIELCAGSNVTVIDHAMTSGIDFRLARGARIGGKVVEEGSSIPVRATVLFFDAEGRQLAESASTAGDGSYLSPMGLPDGVYYVATQNTLDYVDEAYGGYLCAQAVCDVRRSTAITISGGASITAIDLALARGGRIAGTVGTTEGAVLKPLPDVRVEVYGATGLLIAAADTNNNNVRYEVRGLPPGSYFVKTANTLGFVDELHDGIACVSCDPTTGTPVGVAAGQTTWINFDLAKGARLSGSVFDSATGNPIPDAGVIIAVAGEDGRTRIVARVRTSASGVYAVSLPPGTYYVQTDAIDGYATSIYHAPSPGRPSSTVACPLGICGTELGTSIALSSGAAIGRIDLGLSGCPTLAVTPSRLPIGSPGTPYSHTITASGGLAPYGFRVTDGTLPPGLVLGTSGALSGMSSAAGDTFFTIAATDSNGCSGSQTYNPRFCAIDLDKVSASVSTESGSGTLVVTAEASDCPWSATSVDDWLTVNPGSGTGSRTLTYTYAARGVFSQPRSGTIGVGGHTFRLTQSGIAADYAVTPTAIALGPAAGVVRADITTNAPDAPWSVATDATWIEPAVEAGTGSSSIAFQVQRNATRAPRAAQLAIAGRTLTITQRENGIPGLIDRFDAQVFGGLARFNWTPPQRGGDATSYQFEAGLAPGATAAFMATTVPALTVPSVPPGRYFVRVRGQNEFGTGAASDEYELVVGDDGTNPPGAPRDVVGAASAARVVMSWDPPVSGGVARAYVLHVGSTPGASDIGVLQVSTRYEVFDSVPAGYYFVHVHGINGAGEGEASHDVLVRVGDGPSPPDAPQTLSAAVTAHTVTLTAAPPATGPALTGYLLEVGFMRGHTDLVLASDASATALTFANVPSGTYYVRLRATNAQGAGLASNEVRIDIP